MSFHFRLASVLRWQDKMCKLEESELRRLIEHSLQIEKLIEALREQLEQASRQLVSLRSITASEVQHYSTFARNTKEALPQLEAELQRRNQAVEKQREVVVAARTRCRQLEKLQERAFREYTYMRDREQEALAIEAHMARWKGPKALVAKGVESDEPGPVT